MRSHFWKILWLGLGLLPFSGLQSQTLNGDATALGNNCFLITPDSNWQLGSVWFPDTINLNQPYYFIMSLNFGGNDTGADGIVFAFQNVASSALGLNGEGIGYGSIPNSIGIEFDTFENGPQSDPTYDHIAIHRNGNTQHTQTNNLAGPVAALSNQGNIEDSLDHIVEVIWDPILTTLEVKFDCETRLSLQNDLLSTTFFNDTTLFWGFTAASGGFFNPHSVCIQEISHTRVSPDTVRICQGDTVNLTAPPSMNISHAWSPFYNMSDPSLQAVLVWPDSSTTYTVGFQNPCGGSVSQDFYVEVLPPPTVDLGPDDSLCNGSNYLLEAGPGFQYQWSTGSTQQTITVNSPGIYSVTVSNGVCVDSSQIQLFLQPAPVIDLGADRDLCPGDSLLLSLNNFPGTVTWSTGASSDSIWVTQAGNYSVSVDSAGCQSSDTISVTLLSSPQVDLGPADSLVCDQDSLILDPGLSGDSYLWSTGDTTPTLVIFNEGSYSVQVSLNGCLGSDSIDVNFSESPEIDLGPDREHCGRDPLYTFTAGAAGGQSLWSNGETSAQITVEEFGIYWVDVSNECGLASDTVEVKIRSNAEEIFIPNVFTPNGDGINDEYIVQVENPEDLIFQIYDRWGNLLNETVGRSVAWPGRIEDQEVPEGVYYYSARIRDCRGELVLKSGTLTLIR